MTTLKRLLISFLLIGGVLVSSCETNEPGNQDSFDREAMLINIGNNIVIPSFEDFASKTQSLSSSLDALSADVTAANLDAAQQAWLEAAMAWEYAEMFMMGPVDQMVVASAIQNVPTSVTGIEEAIEGTATIDANYIQSIGSTKKGLPAIEYLLFDFANGDEAILTELNSDAKRKAFLVALGERLNVIANDVLEGWKTGGGNYLEVFVSNTGKDAASSTNVLANEFLMLVEKVKNEKLGIPLGKKSMGTMLPENVEARFSGESLALMLSSLDAIEDVFLGTGLSGEDNLGYADYLNELNATYNNELLSEVIARQINNLRNEINDLNNPFKTSLESQTVEVEEAYTAAQQLVVYTKTDMISQLGLLVTYTDNDGD